MMTQKEAVYQAVTNVAESNSDGGMFTPSKDERASINQVLCEGFRAGKIQYDGGVDGMEDKDLRAYVSGLLSNWLRKDKRLNGGVKYIAKNPGSRAGSTDVHIKAMRLLKDAQTDPAAIAEIQGHIDARLATIKPTKTAELDVSALPEELRKFAK